MRPFGPGCADSSAWIRSGSRTRNYLQGEGDRARKVRRAENTFFALRCHFDYSRISNGNCCIPGGTTLLCAPELRGDLTHTASAMLSLIRVLASKPEAKFRPGLSSRDWVNPAIEHHVPEWSLTTKAQRTRRIQLQTGLTKSWEPPSKCTANSAPDCWSQHTKVVCRGSCRCEEWSYSARYPCLCGTADCSSPAVTAWTRW